MDDKIIVSNKAALTAKYGSAGVAKVKAAVIALIAADAKRGLRSRLVYLDDAQAMKRCKGKAVTSASDERQVKLAVDAICRTLDPEYLTILGSVDVVPHQALKNVVPDDEDSTVPSDLPTSRAVPSFVLVSFRSKESATGRIAVRHDSLAVEARSSSWQQSRPGSSVDKLIPGDPTNLGLLGRDHEQRLHNQAAIAARPHRGTSDSLRDSRCLTRAR